MRRVYIEQLGCAKNQVDAEVMLEHLRSAGTWEYTDSPDTADMILVNTCGFIQDARKESIDTLLELRRAYPGAKIMMTGCLAERYAEEMQGAMPEADGFFGNRDLSLVLSAAEAVMDGGQPSPDRVRPVILPDYPDIDDFRRGKLFGFPGSAYVKISEGCDHRCRYCAIPLIRGGLRSRDAQGVIDEVKGLIEAGTYEIDLIAQDLAAFGTDLPMAGGGTGKERQGGRFLDLLDRLSSIPGDYRIRLLYIHPDAFHSALPDLVRERTTIHPYFDIPFQHAAIPVLRGMGRTGSSSSYLELIDTIRTKVPESVIRSTFMLGFPKEGRREFEELLDFVSRAQLDWAGSFLYSREEGTPAYDDRSAAGHWFAHRQALGRRRELERIQQQITETRLDRYVGKVYDVLIEEVVEGEDLRIGRMFAQAPEVDGATVILSDAVSPGEVVSCGIRRRNGIDLEAIPVKRLYIERSAYSEEEKTRTL